MPVLGRYFQFLLRRRHERYPVTNPFDPDFLDRKNIYDTLERGAHLPVGAVVFGAGLVALRAAMVASWPAVWGLSVVASTLQAHTALALDQRAFADARNEALTIEVMQQAMAAYYGRDGEAADPEAALRYIHQVAEERRKGLLGARITAQAVAFAPPFIPRQPFQIAANWMIASFGGFAPPDANRRPARDWRTPPQQFQRPAPASRLVFLPGAQILR
jgi:hypothetical protein